MTGGDDLDPPPPAGVRVPSLLGWTAMAHQGPAAVAEALAERVKLLPGWRLSDQGTALRRAYEFHGEAGALRFLTFIAGLASGAGWTADLELRRQGVRVKVLAPSGQGLSATEFAAAAEVHSAARRLGAVLSLPSPGPSSDGARAQRDGSN